MKSHTTLILLLLVVALGAFIWFFERRADTTAEREAQAEKALRLDPDRVTYLRFQQGESDVTCEKEKGEWYVTAPVRARADAGEVERLLWGLKGLERLDVVKAREQKARSLDPAAYGFEKPRATVTLGDRERRRTFLVGAETAVGAGVYLRDDETGDIIVTRPAILSLLPESATALRDRKLFTGSTYRVDRIHIARRDGVLQLTRGDQQAWRIQQPLDARADRNRVEDLLRALYDARIKDFVADNVAEPAAYGIDETSMRVTLTDEAASLDQTLALGNPVEGSTNLVYGKMDALASIYSVPRSLVDALAVPVETLRDRRLMTLGAPAITAVSLAQGEQELEMERAEGGAWTLTAPVRAAADAAQVEKLLSAWTGARIDSFMDDVDTNKLAALLGPAPLRLRFSTAGEPAAEEAAAEAAPKGRTAVLTAGAKAVEGNITVRVEGERSLYSVDAALLESVSLDPLFYRNRVILDLAPEAVHTLTVEHDGVAQSMERKEDKTFIPVPKAGRAVDEDAVKDLLGVVQHLEAMRFVEENPRDLVRYGLDTPAYTVTIGLTGDAGIEKKTLLVGGQAGQGEVYGMVRGNEIVFTLEDGLRALLGRDLYLPEPASQE